MGKAGRFACIFIPMGLTLASLACLAIVFMGNTNKGNAFLSDLYFMKADTSQFTANPTVDIIPGTNIDDNLLAAFKKIATEKDLQDFYTIGLWNYCDGEITGNYTSKGTQSSYNPTYEHIKYCSGRQANFWFNPIEVWGLNDTAVRQYVPKELDNGLSIYSKVVKFLFTIYVVAIATTAAEVLIGIFAIFSRWGSCVTTIVSSATTLFTFAAALTSTIVYSTFMGTFNTVLKPYRIHATLGSRMLTVNWLAFAFSLGAGLFWLISTCCCSGRSNHHDKHRSDRSGPGGAAAHQAVPPAGGAGFGSWFNRGGRGVTAEKAPYTYERVGDPYYGGGSAPHGDRVPLRDMGAPHAGSGRESAYEPFRHQPHV